MLTKDYSRMQLTMDQVENLLKQNGITDIEDASTGSSFEDDFGLMPLYDASDVLEWLGY
jgi:hypothetical protein